mmetsp:Transcript_3000/g.6934  ORF Transcript_3000/g.6934 Transcript_3000/m.6934 type:complete len:187 (+) Transcript_3000:257-817(+)
MYSDPQNQYHSRRNQRHRSKYNSNIIPMGPDLDSDAIADTLRAQRHFDDMMRRTTPESVQPSFDLDSADETESTSNLSVYSDELYDENTFESYLVGETLCAAMERDEDTTCCADRTSSGSMLKRSCSKELKKQHQHQCNGAVLLVVTRRFSWRHFLRTIVYAAWGVVTFTIYPAIWNTLRKRKATT